MNPLTTLSDSYFLCSWRLRQLHTLIRIGQGDSDEAETIRDEMDDDYMRLSQEENERLDLLSADLNSIGEDSIPGPIQSSIEERCQILDQFAQQDNREQIRHFLDPQAHDPSWNAFIRFLYWSDQGNPEEARPFVQFILACMEYNLADISNRLTKFSVEIDGGIPETGLSQDAEALQLQDQFLRPEEQLRALISTVNLLKSQVGSLHELEPAHEPNASIPSDSQAIANATNEQLFSLFPAFISAFQAA
jgi:hypothetical protein